MRAALLFAVVLLVIGGTAASQQAARPAMRANPEETPAGMGARLADVAWDGKVIPAGQQCRRFGGQGGVPRIAVDGYHSGAQVILLSFNDESSEQMASGGHGVIGLRINGRYATVGGVPGETSLANQGSFVVANNRGGEVPGYLPPCSGGQGHLYSVTVMAVTWADTNPASYRVLNETRVELGRY
jgi:hypothetical protein